MGKRIRSIEDPFNYKFSKPIRLKLVTPKKEPKMEEKSAAELEKEIERREETHRLKRKAEKMYVMGYGASSDLPAGHDWSMRALAEALEVPVTTLRNWCYKSPIKWTELRRAYKAKKNQEDENELSWYTEGLTWAEITALSNSKKIQKLLDNYFESAFDENNEVKPDFKFDTRTISDLIKINSENYNLICKITTNKNLGINEENNNRNLNSKEERLRVKEEILKKQKLTGIGIYEPDKPTDN